jgi:DNA-binding HxlR family transcriptional regulator/catechol 2,3-dioxygenase-like lactoylglutathione lyase family enzyme
VNQLSSPPNPATLALIQRLGEKWTIAVMAQLSTRPHRYSELRRHFKLTSKVLTRTLTHLARHGFVARLESPVMRRQVYYELTPLGESLLSLIKTIERWSARDPTTPRPARPRKADVPVSSRTAPAQDARGARRAGDAAFDPALQLAFVAIAVRDIETSARTFAKAFGTQVPPLVDAKIGVPPNQNAVIRVCWFSFPTFMLALAQPVTGPAPHRAFLAKFGEGIHHLGFSTTQDMDKVITELAKRGGTWSLGAQGAPHAHVDFRSELGAAFGISQWNDGVPQRAAVTAQPTSAPDALSRQRITNIGIVVRDLDEASSRYAEVLRLGVSQIKSVDLALPGVSIVSYGAARIAYLKQHGVAIKLIEPSGPGPLQDCLKRHGNRAHHIGFEVGRYFSSAVAHLESMGGTMILGRRELGYALIDMTKTLGITLELSGTAG